MDTKDRLVIRDYPLLLGGLAAFFLVGSTWTFFTTPSLNLVTYLGILGVSLAVFFFAQGLTITADKTTRALTLDYRSAIVHTVKEFSFDEIDTIRVDSRKSGRHGGSGIRSSSQYWLELILKTGEVIPIQPWYSSDFLFRQKHADDLRKFIGLAEPFIDETPLGMMRAIPKLGAMVAEQKREEWSAGQYQPSQTDGVNWEVQVRGMGSSPLSRWHSPDFKTPGTFLFLAQKVAGQAGSYGGGFMASLGQTLFKQSLALYGFSGADVPDLQTAQVFGPLDASIEPHFSAFTDEPVSARQLLNPWVQAPLARWAQKHPLRQFQASEKLGQLALMYCPSGTYLATLGLLTPEQVQEITALGVELVKAQGVGK
jgi:hypothetical protein